MDDVTKAATDSQPPSALNFSSGMERSRQNGTSLQVWLAAGVIGLAVACVAICTGRKSALQTPHTLLPADSYASSLPLTQFAMSESANLSGGKMTYLDGHVQNAGAMTITAATVQAVFTNDESLPPEVATVPLTLIGMKQPYIDVQPISAHPLKPGDDREFRLTFESVPENWNRQMPMVRVVRVDGR